MNNFQHNFIIKPIAWLVLFVMLVNPALAIQYQHLNDLNRITDIILDQNTRAWHIHDSQQANLIASLKAKGYDVIAASQAEAARFLDAGLNIKQPSIQLAANFNLKRVYESECSHKTTICYREECDKHPKQRRKDCPEEEQDKKSTTNDVPVRVQTNVSVTHRGGFNMPRLSGGNGNDAAAVMLVVIGVVVIAALFIYAGKWVIDQFSNDDDYYAYWWDIGTHAITLDTQTGERGSFTGIKLSGGFVPNMATNFGISFELGHIDLNLLYNRETSPQRIQIEGAYWLIGPQVRWLFNNTDPDRNPFTNTYVFLELLGGSSDRDEVDKMAVARIGINTAIYNHLRFGIHYGAFYLGLEEDQGFANDGDNYWNMYGFELGYQF